MTILSAGISVAGLEACLLQIDPEPKDLNPYLNNRFFGPNETLQNENMILHLARAEELILRGVQAYTKRSHLFRTVHAETHAPQNLYIPGFELARIHSRGMDYLPGVKSPKLNVVVRGSKEHLLFLFFATLTDRRQKSGGDFGVYASHCAIYRDNPLLYTSAVITWDEQKLATILSRYRIGVPDQSAGYWIRCAKTLFEEYNGDPVHLYKSHGATVKGILAFKEYGKSQGKKKGVLESRDPLPGYGPKIASLYSLFLDGFGALPFPKDAFPVDVQVQRLFIQFEAVTIKTRASNAIMEKVLRPFICLIAHYHGLDKQDISHAFWLLGSEGCNSCSKKLNAPQMCPIYDECRGCQNTANYFAKGYWSVEDKPMTRGASKGIAFGMPQVRPVRYSRKPKPESPQVLLFQQ
jgi:endonuclease III